MAIGQKNWLRAQGIDTYDSIQGTIEWEMPSGSRFCEYILTNWIDPESTSAMSGQSIKAIGTRGRFESDQKRRGLTIVTDERGIEEPNPYYCTPYHLEGKVAYRGYAIDSIITFLNDAAQVAEGMVRIEDLEEKRPTFRESVVPTAILEAANRSLQQGGEWVPVQDPAAR
jgi:hypothetical protein